MQFGSFAKSVHNGSNKGWFKITIFIILYFQHTHYCSVQNKHGQSSFAFCFWEISFCSVFWSALLDILNKLGDTFQHSSFNSPKELWIRETVSESRWNHALVWQISVMRFLQPLWWSKREIVQCFKPKDFVGGNWFDQFDEWRFVEYGKNV